MVTRLTIPQWMASGVIHTDQIDPIGDREGGWHFRLGPRRYVYGRWGLSKLADA